MEKQKGKGSEGRWCVRNYVGRKLIDQLKHQGAPLQAMEAGWMIVETANINADDGSETRQRVKLKL